MPDKLIVPGNIRRELEEHAAAEAPNEACGLIAFKDGVAERFLPGVNDAASPYRFELRQPNPDDWYLEDEGYELAIFHSHPTESAKPSRTDIENIGLWEGKPYFILSRPLGDLRAWVISDGQAAELAYSC